MKGLSDSRGLHHVEYGIWQFGINALKVTSVFIMHCFCCQMEIVEFLTGIGIILNFAPPNFKFGKDYFYFRQTLYFCEVHLEINFL
jgi:hypothetical protein